MKNCRSISDGTGLSPSKKRQLAAAALKKKGLRFRIRVVALWRKRWVRLTALALSLPTLSLIHI